MNIFDLLQHGIAQQAYWVLGAAFLSGVISSMLPCCLSMLPILVGYIGGYSQDDKWVVFRQTVLFILGIATTLTLLGMIATTVGVTFGSFIGTRWYLLIGTLALLMGLQLLGVIHLPLPHGVKQLPQIPAYLLGMTFGVTSSPCGTPFLAAILSLITTQHNIVLGGASLFCYAVGQGTLLLIVGLSTGLLKHMARLRHAGLLMNNISATGFIVAGVYLIAQGTGLLEAFLH